MHALTPLAAARAQPDSAPGKSERNTAPLWLYGLIGAAQGMALWAVQSALTRHAWPWGSGAWSHALIDLCLSMPFSWYLAENGFRSKAARLVFAGFLGLLFALIGFHIGGGRNPVMPASGTTSLMLAAAVMGFVLGSLILGFDPVRRSFVYSRLFELAWRNAVLIPVGLLLTGLLWMVLWAGAWLMDSIGLRGLHHILVQPAFYITANCTVFGLALGLAIKRADTLLALRRFWLSLMTWFLPLALALALFWVCALPFTGLHGLFATHDAAFYLLWFVALAVTLANATFQDGREPPLFAPWLATLLTWAWLAVPVLALLGDYALWLRVEQYGWSSSRIWAAVVALMATIYAVGYACSIIARGGWATTLPLINIIAALFQVAIILALISPLADVRKLAVASQVARLESGAVGVDTFDWDFLRRNSGPYGVTALKRLAASPGTDAKTRQISAQASAVLRGVDGGIPAAEKFQLALTTLRHNVTVLPHGGAPEASLLESLAKHPDDWNAGMCIATPANCALWLVDLRGDGQTETVLLRQAYATVLATLYAKEAGHWRKQGILRGGPNKLAEWKQAIEAGHVEPIPPQWPDLTVGSTHVTVQR